MVPVVDDEGRRAWRRMEEFDTSNAGVHPHWPPRFFSRIVDAHLRAMGRRGVRVGDAESYLIDARDLLAFALDVMHAVAHDAGAADRLVPSRDAR